MANQFFLNTQAELSEKIIEMASKVIAYKGAKPGAIVLMGSPGKGSLDVHIEVPYGCLIPDLAYQIQSKIAEECEKRLGAKLGKINISVDGVFFRTAGEQ